MQDALFPLRSTWISQGMNGAYSHRDLLAIDFGWLSASPEFDLFAPFDGRVVFADRISAGATIAFESLKPVRYADGTEDYMTVITAHDNTRPNVGETFLQGKIYSRMGTAGGFAKHCHLEVQRGRFKSYTGRTSQGAYKFPNTIPPYLALWLTQDTYIKEETSVAVYQWRRLPAVTDPVERDEARDQIRILADSLRVRDDANTDGQILGHVEKGTVYNAEIVKIGGDYTWIRIAPEQWVADQKGQWVEFMAKDQEIAELEKEIERLKAENARLVEMYDDLNDKYAKMTKSRNANKEKKNEYLKAIKKAKKYADKTAEVLGAEL